MNENFQELISAFLDGELTPAEQDMVRQHLANSLEEERLLADFRTLGTLLRSLPRDVAPAGMLDAVRLQMERESLLTMAVTEPQPPQKIRRHARWLMSSAAVLLVGLVTWLALPKYKMQSPSATDSLIIAEHTFSRRELLEMSDRAPRGGDNFQAGESMSRVEEGYEYATITMQETKDGMSGAIRITQEPAERRNISSEQEKLSEQLNTARTDPTRGLRVIPPVPRFQEASQTDRLQRLAASPKLSGRLQPGELVRYISVTDDQVAVVELSVVDVSRSFGEIEVLLAGNQIPAMYRGRKSGDKATSRQDEKLPEPSDAETSKPAELMAFYVEASDEQFLDTLEQLESLESIQQVRFGDSPQLSELVYNVVPVLPAGFESEHTLAQDQKSVLQRMHPTEPAEEQLAFQLEQEPSRDALPRSRWIRRQAPEETPIAEAETDTVRLSQQNTSATPPAAPYPVPSAPSPAVTPTAGDAPPAALGLHSLVNNPDSGDIGAYQVPVRLLPAPPTVLLKSNTIKQEQRTMARQAQSQRPPLPTVSPPPQDPLASPPATSPMPPRIRVLLVLAPNTPR